MWGYSFVNREFPDLRKVGGGNDTLPGEVVVVVTRQAGARELTTTAFAARGITARYLGSRDFRVGSSRLPMLVFQLEKQTP